MNWQTPPKTLEWNDGTIHLWRFSIEEDNFSNFDFTPLLSPSERNRAERFVFEKDRIRFSCFRSFLKIILGKYLNRPPASIEFEENSFGKPSLKKENGSSALFFNLSHSENVGIFAFSEGCELGVDVEKYQERTEGYQIAKHYFSPMELKLLDRSPAMERQKLFFQIWTRKEAYIKALGKGFSKDIKSFQVVDENGNFLSKIHDLENPQEFWNLSPLEIFTGYSGALAFPDPSKTLKYFDGSTVFSTGLPHP